MTLDEFLLARVAEDEAAALAASPGPWRLDSDKHPEAVVGPSGQAVVSGGRWGGEAPVFDTDDDAHHIARHDPARVLAECAAKRAIVELSKWGLEHNRDLGDDCCGSFDPDHNAGIDAGDVLRHLAAVYADHPDYDEAWRL